MTMIDLYLVRIGLDPDSAADIAHSFDNYLHNLNKNSKAGRKPDIKEYTLYDCMYKTQQVPN